MIKSLLISNYALISGMEIEFDPGFNIITGETGAGKSIILGALGLLLGERADMRVVRDTARKSVIEAVFGIGDAPGVGGMLSEMGFDSVDGDCILRRELLPGGRSRAFVNDSPVTLPVLRQIAVRLIDIHSQHQNLLLASPDYQLEILDNLAETNELLNNYRSAYAVYRRSLKQYTETRDMIRRNRDDADYIAFQYNELEAMDLQPGETIRTLLPVPENKEGFKSLIFVTRNGVVKRTAVGEFDSINRNGKIAIGLRPDDELKFVKGTTGDDDVIIAGSKGKAIRFHESQIRMMGRTAAGVSGFNTDGGEVVGLALTHEGDTLLSVSENGFGKRTSVEEFTRRSRGGKGMYAIHMTEKTGPLVSVMAVHGDEDAMIVASDGIMIRISLKDVGLYSRQTQGLKLINLNDGATVTRLSLVHPEDEELAEIHISEEESGQSEQDELKENVNTGDLEVDESIETGSDDSSLE